MSTPGDASFATNVQRFSGFASTYDQYRPSPPEIVPEILTWVAGGRRPALVVDLGCGTGLSTRLWAQRADRVIGVEPSADMRAEAQRRTQARNVCYREGFSHATGLDDACADIVTCSQSLHWMQPQETFREVKRILRPGGVFAAIDCDWPPTTSSWEVDAAYAALMNSVSAIEKRRNLSAGLQRWSKDQHLARMQASGVFRLTREIAVHSVETGDAERYVGLAMSMGSVQTVLKAGLSEGEIGLDSFRETARRLLGDAPRPWYFTYRVRLGVV
jgi:ubiquinone/menaquinone biosynthesis C-methylase UbiE